MKSALSKVFPSRAEIKSNWKALLLSFVSGLAGALIFHQNWLGLLGWIALVPYFMAVPLLRGKMLVWASLLFGFTWYYLSCWWLHTLVVFHFLIPVGVAAGAFYYGVYFLLFAFPAAWCTRYLSPAARPWAFAACWTAVEYLRNYTDMAFPWNLLGHSQIPYNQPFMQLTSLGGIFIVSFLMSLVNATIATYLTEKNQGRRMPGYGHLAVIAIVCFLLPLIPFRQTPAQAESSLKVSVIQPGLSQLLRWDSMNPFPGEAPEQWSKRYQETAILMQQTADGLIQEAARQDQPRLIVLPETVFLGQDFPYETYLHTDLTNMARQLNADIFFGADNLIERQAYDNMAAKGQRFLQPDDLPTTFPLPTLPLVTREDGTTMPDFQAAPPRSQMASTVAAWQISVENGLEPRVYNKMQLVPFGEMLPFISGITFLRDVLEQGGIAGAFKPGMENTIFETDEARYGAVICFESTFSYLTRHLANAGAQFICVLTNDSWYDPKYAMEAGGFWGTLFRIPGLHQLASAGPKQHFIHSQLRAMETGLPVVRSANTGISAIIEPDGTIQTSLPYSQGGFLTGEVPIRKDNQPTIYTQWGDWAGLICTGFWAALCVGMFGTRLRRKN